MMDYLLGLSRFARCGIYRGIVLSACMLLQTPTFAQESGSAAVSSIESLFAAPSDPTEITYERWRRNRLNLTELVIFGDSYVDAGNANTAVGNAPPPYYKGRFSDGPLWVDWLAKGLRLEEPKPFVLRGNEDMLLSVGITPDNRWVTTCSGDDTLRFFDLDLKSLREAAKALAGRELSSEEIEQYLLD